MAFSIFAHHKLLTNGLFIVGHQKLLAPSLEVEVYGRTICTLFTLLTSIRQGKFAWCLVPLNYMNCFNCRNKSLHILLLLIHVEGEPMKYFVVYLQFTPINFTVWFRRTTLAKNPFFCQLLASFPRQLLKMLLYKERNDLTLKIRFTFVRFSKLAILTLLSQHLKENYIICSKYTLWVIAVIFI